MYHNHKIITIFQWFQSIQHDRYSVSRNTTALVRYSFEMEFVLLLSTGKLNFSIYHLRFYSSASVYTEALTFIIFMFFFHQITRVDLLEKNIELIRCHLRWCMKTWENTLYHKIKWMPWNSWRVQKNGAIHDLKGHMLHDPMKVINWAVLWSMYGETCVTFVKL